jgi:hypothetical protein
MESRLNRAGYLVSADLDGPNGSAWLMVRVPVTRDEARRLCALMREGAVVHVEFPEPPRGASDGRE